MAVHPDRPWPQHNGSMSRFLSPRIELKPAHGAHFSRSVSPAFELPAPSLGPKDPSAATPELSGFVADTIPNHTFGFVSC